MPHSPFITDQLEKLSRDLHSLIFRCGEPARSPDEVERRIGEGERIAANLRKVFRGVDMATVAITIATVAGIAVVVAILGAICAAICSAFSR